MREKHKSRERIKTAFMRVGKKAWYSGILVLFVCLCVSFPVKQARAQCDGCVVGSLTVLEADLDTLLTGIEVTLADISANSFAIDFDLTAILTALVDPDTGLPAIEFALYGDPIPFAAGDMGIDADMQGGFGAVVESIDAEATEGEPMMAQAVADGMKLYFDGRGMADLAPDSYVSHTTINGATLYALNMRAQMDGFVNAFAEYTTQAILAENTGDGSNRGDNINNLTLCELAPFRLAGVPSGAVVPVGSGSLRYSNKLDNALNNGANCSLNPAPGVPTPVGLLDADLDMGAVFDRIQFYLPTDGPTPLPVRHIDFTPEAQPGDIAPGDGEWQFVAAWRFCEHFNVRMTPPPNSSDASGAVAVTNDLPGIVMDAYSLGFKMPALKECAKALAERTACVQGGASLPTVKINGVVKDCWEIQSLACARLTYPPPSGLGLIDVGNEEVNTALANCTTNGLSLKAFDYAWAHRCNDANYMGETIPSEYGSTTRVREEEIFCEEDKHALNGKNQEEKSNFLQALSMLLS